MKKTELDQDKYAVAFMLVMIGVCILYIISLIFFSLSAMIN